MALNIEDLLADDGGFPVPTMRRPAPEWSGGMGLSPADLEFEPEVGEEMPGEGGVMSGFWDRFATGLANRPVRGLGLIQALAGGRAQKVEAREKFNQQAQARMRVRDERNREATARTRERRMTRLEGESKEARRAATEQTEYERDRVKVTPEMARKKPWLAGWEGRWLSPGQEKDLRPAAARRDFEGEREGRDERTFRVRQVDSRFETRTGQIQRKLARWQKIADDPDQPKEARDSAAKEIARLEPELDRVTGEWESARETAFRGSAGEPPPATPPAPAAAVPGASATPDSAAAPRPSGRKLGRLTASGSILPPAEAVPEESLVSLYQRNGMGLADFERDMASDPDILKRKGVDAARVRAAFRRRGLGGFESAPASSVARAR